MNNFDTTVNEILIEGVGSYLKNAAMTGLAGAGMLGGINTGKLITNYLHNKTQKEPAGYVSKQVIPKSIHEPVIKPQTIEQPVKEKENIIPLAFTYISKNEGLRLKPYIDTKGHQTIGVGHKILPGEEYLLKGITKEEAYNLFKTDLEDKLKIAKRLFPEFDSYPAYLQVALLDGVFRGDHKSTYKTTEHINNGRWEEAAKEYLRNNDYYKSKEKGTGVWERMERNRDQMLRYARELKS